ncbi:MAG: hypothetical protein LBN23_04845 [Paludibacter sp.]|jgi:tetratricopeptide (TPR) repeat protein/DNA-binding CsgD family transcriptional regulator|nr:hypothetical protein [Paludibacter sp.]
MQNKNIFYLIVLSGCFALCGCSDVQHKLRHASQLLKTNQPDSAYNFLRTIQVPDLEGGRKAKYANLLFDAAEQSENTLPPDSLIDFAIEYYGQHQRLNELCRACYYKALLYFQKKQYGDATELLLEAERAAMEDEDKNMLLLGKIYNQQGDIMSFLDNNGNGRAEHKKSLEYFRRADYLKGENDALIDLAYTYTAVADYDSALIFLRQAQRQSPDSAFMGRVLQETGRMYHAANAFDSAIVYLQNSLHYPMVKYQPAMRYELLAEIYFETERYDSAVMYAEEVLKHPATPYILENTYAVLGNVAWIKKTDNFVEYAKKHNLYKDSVAIQMQQPRLTTIKKMHDFKTVANKRGKTIWLIVALAAAVLVITWFTVYRIQKRNREKREMQKKLFRQKMKEQYEALCLQIQHDIKQAELRIEKKRNPADTQVERQKRLGDILKTNLHLNAGSTKFFEFANASLNNLPEKLRNANSELNNNDIILCCLLALGLENEQICIVVNCKPDALLKHKQRLAAKLDLKNVKAMQQVIYDLVMAEN